MRERALDATPRSTWPSRPPTRSSRSTRTTCITDIPVRVPAAPRADPAGVPLGAIREAYRRAEGDPDFAATDDCGVVLRYLPGTPIKVIDGSDENIKVTHPVDVHLADKLFQLAAAQAPRLTDHRSYTEELTGRTIVVFGGSYGIGHDLAELARALRRARSSRSAAPPPAPTWSGPRTSRPR